MISLLSTALPYIQVIVSVALIAVILLQQTGTGVGGALGGSDTDAVHYTRRGLELVLFRATFVLAFLFVASAVLALVI